MIQEIIYTSLYSHFDNGHSWMKWIVKIHERDVPGNILKRTVEVSDCGKTMDFDFFQNNVNQQKTNTKYFLVESKLSFIKHSQVVVNVDDINDCFSVSKKVIKHPEYNLDCLTIHKPDLVFNQRDNLVDPVRSDLDGFPLLTRSFIIGAVYLEKSRRVWWA